MTKSCVPPKVEERETESECRKTEHLRAVKGHGWVPQAILQSNAPSRPRIRSELREKTQEKDSSQRVTHSLSVRVPSRLLFVDRIGFQ